MTANDARSFFDRVGQVAIGSRLRMLTDAVTADAAKIYALYGLGVRPKWFPPLRLMAEKDGRSVTEIAQEIGHSHVSVSKLVKEMTAAGLVCARRADGDRRRACVTLTAAGRELVESLEEVCADVEEAVGELAAESRHDLWRALAEWERLLAARPLVERVEAVRARRAL